MNPNWRKRLDKIAGSIMPHTPGVTFIQLADESEEEMDQRVERWKAGEKVEGIDQIYTGGESSIWLIHFVKPPKRD